MIILVKRAIVRQIPDSYSSCISSHPLHKDLNLSLAREQHSAYVQTLRDLGLDVIALQPLHDSPDCCFVEDTAIIHKSKTVITRTGALSRRGEVESISDVLQQFFDIKFISEPGTIEGGDVLHFTNFLISGISQRTNQNAVDQASHFLGVPIKTISDPSIIHLKSYISYLNDQTILTTQKYVNNSALEGFNKLIIPSSESYAANALSINGTIIIAQGFSLTEQLLKDNGFDIISLETSEIQKCDGALTCLSLLF